MTSVALEGAKQGRLVESKEPVMVEVKLQVPEELARRMRPMGPWLPAVLELGLLGCRTRAAATAVELMELLASNPSPQEVLDFHGSEETQERSRRLLALNEAGLLGDEEKRELDELDQLEHLVVMLKAKVAKDLRIAASHGE